MPRWREEIRDPVGLLGLMVADENPRVRLEAVRALAEFPNLRSSELVLEALAKTPPRAR